MAMGWFKRGWLVFIKHTLNPLTLGMARRGLGPFALIRHTGRKSGRTFETPLILARVPEGFVAELTYGPEVNWYRNVVAADERERSETAAGHRKRQRVERVLDERQPAALEPPHRHAPILARSRGRVKPGPTSSMTGCRRAGLAS